MSLIRCVSHIPILFSNVLAVAVVVACAAAADPLLDKLRGGDVTVVPTEVLPPKSGVANPLRETVVGKCNIAATPGVCRHAFARVPNGKLLEITNVTCWVLMSNDVEPGNFFLTRAADFSKVLTHLVAVIPASRVWERGTLIDRTVTASGPYFFKAGERPFVFESGNPDGAALCTISGNL